MPRNISAGECNTDGDVVITVQQENGAINQICLFRVEAEILIEHLQEILSSRIDTPQDTGE